MYSSDLLASPNIFVSFSNSHVGGKAPLNRRSNTASYLSRKKNGFWTLQDTAHVWTKLGTNVFWTTVGSWLIVFDGIILNFPLKRPLRKPKRQAEKNVPYVVRGNSHPLENRSIWIWLTRWAPCRNFIWINFPFKEKDEEIYNLYSLQLTVTCSVVTSVIIMCYIYPCIIYMLSFRCCSIWPISIMPTNCMQRRWTLTRLLSKTRCLAMQVNFILHICWGSLFPVQNFSARLIIINLCLRLQ